MPLELQLDDIAVDVVRKDIKNVHLSVYPPSGGVRISAPSRMGLDAIRLFAISKLGWIRQQQRKLRDQERETPREYLDRESHYVWGERYLLSVIERDQGPSVTLERKHMILSVRAGTDRPARDAIVAQWYRRQIRAAASDLCRKWESIVGRSVDRVLVQRMKTRWGSCNPTTRTIRLNTELAKKPKECLEYVLAHEMVHLVEPTHGPGFLVLMDRFMPQWRHTRTMLNRLPSKHEDWHCNITD